MEKKYDIKVTLNRLEGMEIFDEDIYGNGVISDLRFVRKDWVQKTIKPERLARLLAREDVVICKAKVSWVRSWQTIEGYIFNTSLRGEWAYTKSRVRVDQAYDYSEVL